MSALVLVAIVLMVTVLGAGFRVLQADAFNRRIDRQLKLAAFVSATRGAEVEDARSLHIRSARRRDGRSWLTLVTGYDPQAAQTGPVWLVVSLAMLAAGGDLTLGRMALPSWALLPTALLTAMVVTRTLFKWQRDRYADRLLRQLPDTIELIVSAVRAGLPIAEALRAIAREMPDPTREQFARVIDELAVGRAPHEALLSVHDRTRVSEYAIFAVTLAVQNRSGGALAETLQILGDTVRQRVALAGRAKALAGQAQLSARVLAALPFAAGALMFVENPHALDPLFSDPRGQKLFVAGIVSLLLGILTMRRMIKKATTV
jgi:tight adherence protein B